MSMLADVICKVNFKSVKCHLNILFPSMPWSNCIKHTFTTIKVLFVNLDVWYHCGKQSAVYNLFLIIIMIVMKIDWNILINLVAYYNPGGVNYSHICTIQGYSGHLKGCFFEARAELAILDIGKGREVMIGHRKA